MENAVISPWTAITTMIRARWPVNLTAPTESPRFITCGRALRAGFQRYTYYIETINVSVAFCDWLVLSLAATEDLLTPI
jgi:hypothetical protein